MRPRTDHKVNGSPYLEKRPEMSEADRLAAFLDALVYQLQRRGFPIPGLDVDDIRQQASPEHLATSADVIAAITVDNCFRTIH